MNQRTALLVGATGLVGGHCLQRLLNDEAYEKVVILVRKPTLLDDAKLEEHVVDFDRIDQHAPVIKGNDVFCCLGTTMKVAGSKEAFRKVDVTYPVQVGAIAAKNGAEQFLIISAIGADSESRVFYNRVKGDVEETVSKLPFEAIHIFRPSLLLGDRKEQRRGEKVGISVMRALSLAMAGPLRKYQPIEANTVAHAMVLIAKSNQSGLKVYESDRIQAIYDGAR